MNNDILISVIMSVYNTRQEYLNSAVRSILKQTYSNFELLIVDDGSEKELYSDTIFRDTRIRLFRLDKNVGIPNARNIGLKKARGKYIAIMDSDDISHPDRFEKQLAFMESHPNVAVCGTWFQYFGDKTHEVKRVIDDNEYYRCCLLFRNAPTILNPSVMIRASLLKENSIQYDIRLRKGEDYKMWVQLSQVGLCTNLKEILVDYRVHESQTSAKLRTKDVSEYDWIVLKEQYDSLGLKLTADEEAMLKKDFRSPAVSPMAYRAWLDRVIQANEISHCYQPDKLKKRVEEQWISKLQSIKNPFTYAGLYCRMGTEDRKIMIDVQKERIARKLLHKG